MVLYTLMEKLPGTSVSRFTGFEARELRCPFKDAGRMLRTIILASLPSSLTLITKGGLLKRNKMGVVIFNAEKKNPRHC